MKLTNSRIRKIQAEVLTWYAANKRDLPWRQTRDPYAILVSEIMLQQTQVSRVVPKYHEFLKQFPTVQILAAATPAAVIRAWKGLGYNRRALNLQKAARTLVKQANNSPNPSLSKRGTPPFAKGRLGGIFPQTVEELMKLPGIGRYTAGAVATFAFGVVAPAVDTNVRRFIDSVAPSRVARSESDYYELAAKLIPADRPAEWLHAVMDYTSLVLRRGPAASRRRVISNVVRDPVEISRQTRNDRLKKSEPFIGSNRYLRGRTIDLLRAGAASADELYRRVAKPVVVGEDRYGLILTDLTQEGLIEQARGRYQLRES